MQLGAKSTSRKKKDKIKTYAAAAFNISHEKSRKA
jgi:hypothetical protein